MPSVHLDTNGPDWPLGFIDVTNPGTLVNIMVNIDAFLLAQGGVTNNPDSSASSAREYSYRCNQIMFIAQKPKQGGGTQLNSGNVYIMRAPAQIQTGGKGDTGSLYMPLTPGAIHTLAVPALDRNTLNPYRYFLDADNAGEGAFVTLIIG